jgi:4-hydroxy-3-methylbut-2-enyl diphosphate reductase
MKLISEPIFEVIVAEHYGMCFGVKAAIEDAEKVARDRPVTILGRLAHNPSVQRRMLDLGARVGELHHGEAPTDDVLITAHGASDRDRAKWQGAGHTVTDTTCPLVHKAHAALRGLVSAGYSPVVIGKQGHVEVRGLTGDFPGTQVVLSEADVEEIRGEGKLGIISQTTQPIDKVEALVDLIRQRFPQSDVQFIDTVCRPTKERQQALLDLCSEAELVIVVGGNHSNNTRELTESCRRLGCLSRQVEKPEDIDESWFSGITRVGVTAGTSTPDEDVFEVVKSLNLLRFRQD